MTNTKIKINHNQILELDEFLPLYSPKDMMKVIHDGGSYWSYMEELNFRLWGHTKDEDELDMNARTCVAGYSFKED